MRNAFKIIFLVMLYPIFSLAKNTRSNFTLPSKVEVTIIEAPFYKNKFKIEKCSGNTDVCRINGKIPFGTTFYLPKTYVKSIVISFQGKSYALDVSNMYDAWRNSPLEYSKGSRYFGGKCFDVKNCQFRGIFSDAAGAFVAEWIIANGRQFRTVLTDRDDVVGLFMKNIDPPEYE